MQRFILKGLLAVLLCSYVLADEEEGTLVHHNKLWELRARNPEIFSGEVDLDYLAQKLHSITQQRGTQESDGRFYYPLEILQILAMLHATPNIQKNIERTYGPSLADNMASLNMQQEEQRLFVFLGEQCEENEEHLNCLAGIGADIYQESRKEINVKSLIDLFNKQKHIPTSLTFCYYGGAYFVCASYLTAEWPFPATSFEEESSPFFKGSLTTHYQRTRESETLALPFGKHILVIKYGRESDPINAEDIKELFKSAKQSLSFEMPCVKLETRGASPFVLTEEPTALFTQEGRLAINADGVNVGKNDRENVLEAGGIHLAITSRFHLSVLTVVEGEPLTVIGSIQINKPDTSSPTRKASHRKPGKR